LPVRSKSIALGLSGFGHNAINGAVIL